MGLVVVDYKAGNLRSVETALQFLGARYQVTNRSEDVANAERVIFPGVGEARAAMDELRLHGLDNALREFYHSGRPMFGICIGAQIVLNRSEERDTECLGIVPGVARRFSPTMGLKVPHMGWNQVRHGDEHPIFRGIPDGASFYFVHSYYPDPANGGSAVATTDYGTVFTSAFAQENLVAVQFHPEKSGEFGLRLLSNFIESREF
jgi:glutamine amidotransferase